MKNAIQVLFILVATSLSLNAYAAKKVCYLKCEFKLTRGSNSVTNVTSYGATEKEARAALVNPDEKCKEDLAKRKASKSAYWSGATFVKNNGIVCGYAPDQM